MIKKIFLSLVITGIVIAASFFIYKKYVYKPPVHYHAGFRIYLDGKLQDYSSTEFMHLKPCGAHEETGNENEQLEKAHLHDNVGDVIHVHRNGVMWNDIFTNLKIKIPADKTLTSYINGKKIPNIKTYPVKPYDSLVLMIGKADTSFLKNAVTINHIKQNEKKSESCGS